MRRLRLPAVALLTLCMAADATATRPPPMQRAPVTAFNHDGFLMRLSIGAGFNAMTLGEGQGEVSLSGLGGMASFAFGGIVVGNLAINADLFGMSTFEPSVSLGGRDVGEARDTTVSFAGIGVGVTYYLMPANIYFAGSIGPALARLEFRSGDLRVTGDSKVGVGLNVMIGKEWWVAREWGVGVAAQFMFGALPRDRGDDNFGALGAGILFTATYN